MGSPTWLVSTIHWGWDWEGWLLPHQRRLTPLHAMNIHERRQCDERRGQRSIEHMWLDTDQIIIHGLICHQLISQVIQVISVFFGSPNMQLFFFFKSGPQVITFLNIILSVFTAQLFQMMTFWPYLLSLSPIGQKKQLQPANNRYLLRQNAIWPNDVEHCVRDVLVSKTKLCWHLSLNALSIVAALARQRNLQAPEVSRPTSKNTGHRRTSFHIALRCSLPQNSAALHWGCCEGFGQWERGLRLFARRPC